MSVTTVQNSAQQHMVAGMCIVDLAPGFGTIVETISALIIFIKISKYFTCFSHNAHMYMQGTVCLHLQHALSMFVGIVCLSGEGNCLVANDPCRVLFLACCNHAKVLPAW